MKKIVCLILASLLVLGLAACAGPVSGETATAETTAAGTASSGVVTFADPVLETMVREAMGKPEGDITQEEAKTVTELQLNIEWQQEPVEGTQIKDISGLEYFTNLKNLELHFHAITDISPLAGLVKLESLSLGGNPVADISPLSGLTNLGWLTLFNCQAEDYSPLANLVNLGGLLMEYSTISDVSMLSGLTNLWWLGIAQTQVSDIAPLASLTNLKKLQLEGCPITDYSPLAEIYPNLEEKDFTMAFSLAELGFTMDDTNLASYNAENVSVKINHSEWGDTPEGYEMEVNAVHMYMELDGGYYLIMGYYPDSGTYVFAMNYDDDKSITYFYDPATGDITFSSGDRESAESALQGALGDTDSEDILLAPLSLYNDTLMATFSMDADALYALPFERTTLLSLGFTADHDNAVCVYEQQEGGYISVAVYRPEWGNREYSVEYYALINGYNVTVWYYQNEQRYYVRAENPQDGTTADFEFFAADDSRNDGMSPEGVTVEEYFKNVYNDPEIEDVYLYSVLMAQQYINDTFGISIDELYALPVGE